ncbi:polysaccharide deacetylase family protein [Rhizorhabdus sp. FW153]|uniref:polysaccharide deacetylase family protein n=1 Tax=Rhizorhabdus sp. FW153 TaxID=3400216 RepID=UPI003CE6E293
MQSQIFHDPTGRRAIIVRWSVRLVAALSALALLVLGVALLTFERRSAPALPGFDRSPAPLAAAAIQPTRTDSAPWLPSQPATGETRRLERTGFYMPWDAASRESLTSHGGELDFIAAGLATVHGADHRWRYESDPHLRQVLGSQSRRKLLLMVQNVSIETGWDGKNSARLFADAKASVALIDRIEKAALVEQARGVLLDFENLPPSAHEAYRAFLERARKRLSARGLLLTIAAPVGDPDWALARYAPSVDRLFLMAYDEHWPEGEAGPIASQAWFVDVVGRAVAEAGRDKAIVAIGNYAYDWGKAVAEPLTVAQAWERAAAAGTMPRFDRTTGNSHVAYTKDGVPHQLWILDALSAWNDLQTTRHLGAKGMALWRLGSEDPGFWQVLATPAGGVPEIGTMPNRDHVQLLGSGEILRLARRAEPGRRDLSIGEDGLIRDARYTALPSHNVIQRTGLQQHRVALTFDDGPDPRWTPQILDVLKREGVPATFFVTGANALGEADLLRRIVDEGSELGNHSTTHPDLDRMPEAAIRLEINTTQRLVESYTGRSMRLFRAPYLGDAEPNTAAELRASTVAAEMGYLSVGLNVDPLDWTTTTADRIVQRTVDQVLSGKGVRATQIVLLHDSGGDRSATVAALPGIIAELRARGYTFVTVSRLAGLDRDAAMPPLVGAHGVAADGASGLFGFLALAGKTLGILLIVAIGLGIARALLMTVLALVQARRPGPPDAQPHLVPAFVSVLIPAYNEDKVIEASVRRVLGSQGPRIEVIVIDDGSTDRTGRIVADAFGLDPRVTLLSLPNGGKARALNEGLRLAKGEVVIALDADTQFEADTIARLTRWFADPSIGAVAGNAKIGNRVNLVTRWQALEYVTAQNLERRALAALGAVTVVPGAVGAWRRAALDEVGGYPHDTLAEDQDLTIAIRRAGWNVACDADAIAWTEAPDSFRALFRQRYRWAFGTLQCLWKHRGIFLTGRPRGLALVGLPQAWLFQIGLGLVSPLIDLALIVSIADTLFRTANHGFAMMEQDLRTMFAFWLAFAAIDASCAWVAYRLDGREGRFPLLRLLAQRFGYRQLLYAVVLKAVMSALRGPRVAWGKLDRSGVIQIPFDAGRPRFARASEAPLFDKAA